MRASPIYAGSGHVKNTGRSSNAGEIVGEAVGRLAVAVSVATGVWVAVTVAVTVDVCVGEGVSVAAEADGWQADKLHAITSKLDASGKSPRLPIIALFVPQPYQQISGDFVKKSFVLGCEMFAPTASFAGAESM